jgi:DNA mismatch repair ATPase MutS
LKRFCLQSELIAPVFEKIKTESGIEGIEIKAQSEARALLDPENTRAATFYLPDTASRTLLAVRKEKRALEEAMRRAETKEARAKFAGERSAVAAQEDKEETRIRAGICESLRPLLDGLAACMDAIADFDFTLARAKLAKAYGGCPVTFTENEVSFVDMINPRVADALKGRERSFTPVSIEARSGAAVITGANMGGKSVALKTLALNALLVKAGLLPFAKQAKLPLFEGIFIVAEDMEDIDRGLSSFGAEIAQFNETLQAVLALKGVCLILLDEFARGTNPEEGAMIVRAVTRRLNKLPHISVLTTHYDGVAAFGNVHYEVVDLREMDVGAVAREIASNKGRGADVIAAHMNYGLYRAEGYDSCPRDARNICRLLDMDSDILADLS